MKIQLTKFGERHFNRSFNGTKILDYSAKEFEGKISDMMKEVKVGGYIHSPSIKLIDGYADFCKLLVIRNFTDAKTGTLPITLENHQYLRSGYFSRTKTELPVLSRWFEIPKMFIPKAEYLIVILYTYDQLFEEHQSKAHGPFKLDTDTDYGIVAILAQMTDDEEPMQPLTMMRNSMDKKFGGSGVPLDEEAYRKSADFWKENATVK